jgi:hypothetical protein
MKFYLLVILWDKNKVHTHKLHSKYWFRCLEPILSTLSNWQLWPVLVSAEKGSIFYTYFCIFIIFRGIHQKNWVLCNKIEKNSLFLEFFR